ncbi:hypothetical protein D0962_23305 [Leptolyngbyaceae cyanobacterium CCMR0082]|uniref:Uncharacterized protein n=1 Tax=Adonisia turfae CCMR0082 TaxID=2304604 RepID=A0A6M0SAZ5_9CYAN|nr:hypothetical protein [Adonisia turfae]NEZ65647.1 hypothetical protein [Adonisia turfae CCMR0082]
MAQILKKNPEFTSTWIDSILGSGVSAGADAEIFKAKLSELFSELIGHESDALEPETLHLH